MMPFRLDIQPGESVYRQVVYAVKRAIVSGRLRPGDPFPSVRRLSQELKINPNTAHKVVQTLISDGLLVPRPGIGTQVADASPPSPAERQALLERDVERLAVEAKNLDLDLQQVTDALRDHWRRLSRRSAAPTRAKAKGTRRTGKESK